MSNTAQNARQWEFHREQQIHGIERLENRTLLASATALAMRIVHVDAGASKQRFFSAIHALPSARTSSAGTPLAKLPARSVAPFDVAFGNLKTQLQQAPREFTKAAANPLLLDLPRPDGAMETFRVVDAPVMAPELAAQFPQIRTFRGQAVDDPTASIRLDYTPLGFHAQVLSAGGSYFIDPYFLNSANGTYVAYFKKDATTADAWQCTTSEAQLSLSPALAADSISPSITYAGTLKTYRTAVAADGEYTAAVGGGTVSGGQAAVVTAINRVTGVYESELDIRLVLVANNSSLIYTDSSTDPYSNNNGSRMLGQNQTTIDSVIGNANYDIGHVFSTGGGGVAYLGVVGKSGLKAGGVTGLPNPVGDAFYIDYVAHEMGHQFGANHTFNTAGDTGNRNASTAYEPGSGSTIMAYAGIEGTDDLQAHSDPYFHSASIDEIRTYIGTIPSVGTSSATGNSAPIVSAGSNYTIPTGTPFALTASGSDPDGDPITYEWQERDLGSATYLNSADNGSSPLFRDWVPSTSPTRLLPQLSSILAGSTTTGSANGTIYAVERLYTVARTSHWRVIARDNKTGGGGVSTADMTLTVVNTGGAFAVTSANTSTTWNGGSVQTINWNVAGTTGNGINVANVKISLSTDGGNTFPTVLAASTANDGSEAITLPNVNTSTARIKVEAVGNIFFDINNSNIVINGGSPIPNAPVLTAASDTGFLNDDQLTKLDNSAPAKVLQFTVANTTSGATIKLYADGTFIGSAVASGTSTTVTTNGTTTLSSGAHQITATQTVSGMGESFPSSSLPITVDAVAPTLTSPPTFSFDSAPQSVVYVFSENVQPTFTPDRLTLVNTTTSSTIFTTSVGYNSGSNTAYVSFASSILPDGNYSAQLNSAAVTDLAGNPVSGADTPFTFFVLAGDANRDRTVDASDLGIVSLHWASQSGNTFSTGDFNYDGRVDVGDLLILANNWQKKLDPPAVPSAPAALVAAEIAPTVLAPPPTRATNSVASASASLEPVDASLEVPVVVPI